MFGNGEFLQSSLYNMICTYQYGVFDPADAIYWETPLLQGLQTSPPLARLLRAVRPFFDVEILVRILVKGKLYDMYTTAAVL